LAHSEHPLDSAVKLDIQHDHRVSKICISHSQSRLHSAPVVRWPRYRCRRYVAIATPSTLRSRLTNYRQAGRA
jgi:hypothetical protein